MKSCVNRFKRRQPGVRDWLLEIAAPMSKEFVCYGWTRAFTLLPGLGHSSAQVMVNHHLGERNTTVEGVSP
jgi:hypothetical protein